MTYLIIGLAFAISSYIVVILKAYKLAKNIEDWYPTAFFMVWTIMATLLWPVVFFSLLVTSPKEIAAMFDAK